MNHESRILQDMLIAGKIDTIEPDTYMGLSQQYIKGEISEDEFVERYNRLIEQEAEKHWEPVKPHEHI